MFTKVFERLKCPSKFVDINDVSTRSEYWGAYLLLTLPLGILSSPFLIVPHFLDEIGVCSKILLVMGTCLSMLGWLSFFPVLARRLRDIGISPWFAVLCVAPSFFPYLAALTGVAIIVFGCLPGKGAASAEQGNASSSSSPAFFWMVSVVLFVFIGVRTMQGNIAAVEDSLTNRFKSELNKSFKNAFGSPSSFKSTSKSSNLFDFD